MMIADLDKLAAQYGQIVVQTPPTHRAPRQQIIGAMKMINWLCGGDMQQEIDSVDFLVRRIDKLEDQAQEREAYFKLVIERYETEKRHYQQQEQGLIAGYKKALRNIAAVLSAYSDPFDSKPFSKWNNVGKGQWMVAVAESVQWAVQRADNTLDPTNAVPIALDAVS